jgi:hypothetical protein
MGYRGVANLHRHINRTWYTETVQVERNNGMSWDVRPAVSGMIQYRFAFSSSPDPDIATVNDAEIVLLFCDPASDITVSDRVTVSRTGDVWFVVALDDARTTSGSLQVTMTAAEMAVAGETVTFRRHRGAGVFEEVGTFVVQFTEQPTQTAVGGTAVGSTISGTMVAGPAAGVIVPGDYFARGDAPGRVVDVERDRSSGRVQIAYALEVS